jgi:hypothetical protein
MIYLLDIIRVHLTEQKIFKTNELKTVLAENIRFLAFRPDNRTNVGLIRPPDYAECEM